MATTKKTKKRVCSEETRRKMSEKAKARWAKMGLAEQKSVKNLKPGKVDSVMKRSEVRWDLFLEVFERNNGHMNKTCQEFGVHSAHVYRHMISHPDFKAKIKEIQDSKETLVLDKFFELIEKGDRQAIIFYLQTHGWHPGSKVDAEVSTNVKIFDLDPIKNNK